MGVKGRPAPGWERVWTAFVWGQALAAAALCAVVAPQSGAPLLLAAWGCVSIAALAASSILQAAALARYGPGATGILLLLLASYHALFAAGADPVAWTIDAVLALSGVGLLAGIFFARPRSAAR